MNYTAVARVTHYYSKLGVAVLALSGPLAVGDVIHIAGHTTDFYQRVKSMQIDHHAITEGVPGDDVALQVLDRVREGDQVYKIDERDALEFLAERTDIAAAYT